MWTKEGTKWCPYCPQCIAPQIWPCLAFSHLPSHIPHHWNMLKEWCTMMSLMFGFIWPWYFTPVMTWFFGNFIMPYLCLKQYFANICTSLSLFGFTEFVCIFQIFEIFMLHVLLKQHFTDIYIILAIWLCLALLLLYSCDHIIFSRFFQIF